MAIYLVSFITSTPFRSFYIFNKVNVFSIQKGIPFCIPLF